eukprot:1342455-Prymnesium_polylepis.1
MKLIVPPVYEPVFFSKKPKTRASKKYSWHTHMTSPPTWQVRVNTTWHDCDLPTSSLMEAAFGVHHTTSVKLPFAIGRNSSALADFDLNDMTFGYVGAPYEGTCLRIPA